MTDFFGPRILFTAFLATLLALSYFPSSPVLQGWMAGVGLVLPFLVGGGVLLRDRFRDTRRLPPEEQAIPGSWFLLFLFLVPWTCFYHLTSLPLWPIRDEGTFAFLSMHLARKWEGGLLFGETRAEPLFIWVSAFFFKCFQPSLGAMRLLPALLSIADTLVSYWAARRFFSKPVSFLTAWFCGLSFWQFTLARFFMPGILGLLFLPLCFGLWGLYRDAPPGVLKKAWLFLTSVTAGLGFYASTIWASTWAAFGVLFALWVFKKRGKWVDYLFFLLLSLGIAFPLVGARFSPGNMEYIQSRWAGFFPGKTAAAYLRALFWDGRDGFPFGSDWGGCFNPIAGALAVMGCFYALRFWDRFQVFCGATCLLFMVLPAMLSTGLEIYRMESAFPLLACASALGVLYLFPDGPGKKRWWPVAGLLAGSLALDANNFIGHYADISKAPPGQQWRSVEYHDAYQILKDLSEKTGPLYVLNGFNRDYDDKTLEVACYPFDAVENPRWGSSHPAWMAFLDNIDFGPFLKKRFPRLEAYWLNPSLPAGDLHRHLGLFLLPAGDMPLSTQEKWVREDRFYRELEFNVKNKNRKFPWSSYAGQMSPLEGESAGDPYLASVFWEKTASFRVMAGDFRGAAEAYQEACRKGYPANHLLQNLARARLWVKTRPLGLAPE